MLRDAYKKVGNPSMAVCHMQFQENAKKTTVDRSETNFQGFGGMTKEQCYRSAKAAYHISKQWNR